MMTINKMVNCARDVVLCVRSMKFSAQCSTKDSILPLLFLIVFLSL